MKKAFTLVELLVVIGIIAVLAGTLMVSMGGGSEAARSANCLTNMRSLANAAVAYASSSGYYPLAGSVATSRIDESQGIGKGRTVYAEVPGWLSWESQGQFPATSNKSPQYPSAYAADPAAGQELRDFAVTNGALKATLAGNRGLLVCPEHKIATKTQTVFFTYVMNEYFYWDNTGKARGQNFYGRYAKGIKYADRRLLFAELNWKGYVGEKADDTPYNEQADPVLQYSKGECIGFNHKKGSEKYAHVAFADGHTEEILLPRGNFSDADLKELTKLLCEGKDVVLEGDKYKELQ